MDIFSHAGWSAVMYSSRPKRSIWLAVILGIAPDFISFGPHFITEGILYHLRRFGPPDLTSIPPYIFTLYNYTHSLVVWALATATVCFIARKIVWEMGAWGLHILIDIFSHDIRFFPTPFLWPINGFKVDGVSWGQPWFLAVNYGLLMVVGTLIYLRKKHKLQMPGKG